MVECWVSPELCPNKKFHCSKVYAVHNMKCMPKKSVIFRLIALHFHWKMWQLHSVSGFLNCKEALSSSVFLSSTGSHVIFLVIIMSLLLIITLVEHPPCVVALYVKPPHPRKDVLAVFKASRVLAVLHWSRVRLFTWTFDTLWLTLPVSMNKPINRIFLFTGKAVCQETGWNKWRRRCSPSLLLSTMLAPAQEIRFPVLQNCMCFLFCFVFL